MSTPFRECLGSYGAESFRSKKCTVTKILTEADTHIGKPLLRSRYGKRTYLGLTLFEQADYWERETKHSTVLPRPRGTASKGIEPDISSSSLVCLLSSAVLCIAMVFWALR